MTQQGTDAPPAPPMVSLNSDELRGYVVGAREAMKLVEEHGAKVGAAIVQRDIGMAEGLLRNMAEAAEPGADAPEAETES